MNHDGYGFYQFKTCFCEFNSINDILCLIYVEDQTILISYDIISKQIITRVNKNKIVNNIRHYLDNQLKRDLILISFVNNIIEVSNFQNWELLLNITEVNKGGFLFSSCFFNSNNNIYILTSNNKVTNIWNCENIKVFDMKKNKIKEINNSNEDIFFIDNYYDSKLDKNFIVTCNCNYIKLYDFENNSLFKKYNDSDFIGTINDFVVDERGKNKTLLGSCIKSIRIWDFYTGEILQRIICNIYDIYGLCLFDKNYVLAGQNREGNDYIILLDLIKGEIVNKINIEETNSISHIKDIETKKGKIFVSGGRWSDIIIFEMKNLDFCIQNRIEIQPPL